MSDKSQNLEEKFLSHAIALARKGLGLTSPNPTVGAVLVKDGRVVGVGYTRPAGGSHAEIVAIKNAGERARDATLYVTLEPCCHFGKTPPCVDAIISAGVKYVVIGMKDPFPQVNGQGIRQLKRHNIAVDLLSPKNKLAHEVRLLNQPFIKAIKTGLPYVILKAAVSLDGKIATRSGDSKWITGEAARVDARMERSRCDAVLVGAGTVAADDPELAPHGLHKNKKLLRVIIDCDLSSDFKKRVFRDKNVFVACADTASLARRRAYERAKVEWRSFGKKNVSVLSLLKYLYCEKGVQSLFVEGGAGVHGSFYDAVLRGGSSLGSESSLRGESSDRQRLIRSPVIDKVIFYIAPKIIGGIDSVSAVGGRGVFMISANKTLKNVAVLRLGLDTKISGCFDYY